MVPLGLVDEGRLGRGHSGRDQRAGWADQDRGGLAARRTGAPNRTKGVQFAAFGRHGDRGWSCAHEHRMQRCIPRRQACVMYARVPTATVMSCALSRTMLILEARDGPMMATSSFRVALEAHDPCEARPRGSQDDSYDAWSRRFGPARQQHGPDRGRRHRWDTALVHGFSRSYRAAASASEYTATASTTGRGPPTEFFRTGQTLPATALAEPTHQP
jgi:hypothetical protein